MTHKKQLFIHCLATENNFMAGRPVAEVVAAVKRWHLARGWRDIGYAGVIHRDGSYAGGRDTDNDGDYFEETGAHAKGFNVSGIGVALVGGKHSARTDKFSDNYTEAQRAALWEVIDRARARYGDEIEIRGHNEVSSKACPGFNVQEFLSEGRPSRGKTTTAMAAAAVGGGGALAGALVPDGWQTPLTAIAVVALLVVGFIIWRKAK